MKTTFAPPPRNAGRLAIAASFAFLTLFSCKKPAENVSPNSPNSAATVYDGPDSNVISIGAAQLIAERLNAGYMDRTDTTIKTRTIASSYSIDDANGIPAMYVFNYTSQGFSIISADYRYEPVLAYVDRSSLNINDTLPPMMVDWIATKTEDIGSIRSNTNTDTSDYDLSRQRWSYFVASEFNQLSGFIEMEGWEPEPYNPCINYYQEVKPKLLQTTWGQKETFNDLIPMNCSNGDEAPTGCVATAMAQLIRYWQPVTSHGYNYASMPVNYGNGEVQRLMYDAAESVNMMYSCYASGASSSDVENALVSVFNFSSGGNYQNYGSSSKWDIRNDLLANKPVYVSGYSGTYIMPILFIRRYTGGHAWLIEGFTRYWGDCSGSTFMYWMNWGDNGYLDGWFNESNWTVGSSNYQYNRKYYKNIHL